MKELTAEITKVINNKLSIYEEQIKNIREDIKQIQTENKKLKMECAQKTEELEQQYKINNLRFCGIPETRRENLKDIIMEFCQQELKVTLVSTDICRCRRLGKFNPTSSKHRPILVYFSSYVKKDEIFKTKKLLKNKKYFIGEDLTFTRLTKYNEAVFSYGKTNVWTVNGVIYVKPGGDNTKVKKYEKELINVMDEEKSFSQIEN